jgi:hypothetical protein
VASYFIYLRVVLQQKQTLGKIQTLILFVFFTLTCYSQDKVSSYKKQADKAVLNYFDKSLPQKIRCTDVVLYGLDSNIIYFGDYEQAKNERKKLSSVEFYYSFYSTSLKYTFKFQITVDRKKKVISDSSDFDQIPNCISKAFNCNFIKKDSAIKIAINDSISYPDNLDVRLYKHYKNDNYFWFVTGSPTIKKTTTRRTSTKIGSPRHERIINAVTGELIPYNEYLKL